MSMPLRAFVMSWTDKSLVANPVSCWIIADVHTDLIDGGQTSLEWIGWATMQDFFLKADPIGQHITQLTGAQYLATLTAITATAVGQTLADLNAQALATWGLTTLDTPATNADGTPQLDAQGQPVMRAFFNGASVVTLAATAPQP